MDQNIEIDAAAVKTLDIELVVLDPVLVEHVAEIRRLGKRAVEDVIEIGRHLTACREIVGHGNWLAWLDREFGWSEATARNFMRVHELAEAKSANFADLNLPISTLYLLAAPSTPEEVRTEIFERAAGEPIPGAEVKETIARAKRMATAAPAARSGTDYTESAAESAEKRKALYADAASSDPVALDDARQGDDQTVPATSSLRDVPEPDRATIAAAAVNQLSPTELLSFLDQLSPVHVRAFEQKFGARSSDNVNADIAQLAAECAGMMRHPEQHRTGISEKLARIKRLAGPRRSNARLDRGALRRGLGIAGHAGKKFPTIEMSPTGDDPSGNPSFALDDERADASRPEGQPRSANGSMREH